ncbi:unnamed protein product [Fusarium graminearum]|uniref:Chromosome 2, complete genome n=1 Tax=Gibberella zeae (strain ATCC MYA-4620 / CBS 123657 / FGSC 9075 / NRRL 31084 / PH-1) TaxID=229533 RepID=A0A098DDK1_GIBZE|nr:unnamed protein product [Fusarium graminearum]CEF76505.1 unnamed protein product [Fusarium graminearum]CZS79798.1 unnamed protein product [Fusarium graminearum]
MMGFSKRQLCCENNTELGNSSKRRSVASRSEGYDGPVMDFDQPYCTDYVEEVSMIEEDNDSHQRICYGTICSVSVSLCSDTKLPETTRPWERYCLFGVQVGAGSCCLEPGLDAEPKQRSLFDADTVLTLSFLTSKVQQVSFAAVIGVNALDRKRRNSAKMIVKATVNVYGPKYLMDEVDQALSHIPSSLQHPVFLEPGVPYINPQFFYPSAEKTDLRYLVGPAYEDTTSHVSRTVDKFSTFLDLTDPSIVISFKELSSYLIGKIQNPSGRRTKRHLCPSTTDKLSLGGILADVMGLGKTLTMLSAILCSKHLKHSYDMSGSNNRDSDSQQTDLTLIVLPSRQLLDVWKNEIAQRFRPQTFKVHIFHGQTRAKNQDQFLDSDIVLTTYHTLEKDSITNSILNSIRWSRIVLDEAHHIRNSSTKMHKAAVALQSETRWCLTGTPIQNSLDDLRSLFQFLRLEPFCRSKAFEEYIVKPFRQDTSDSYEAFDPSQNLRTILKACFLRRTQLNLRLPTITIYKVPVTPTDVEKAMFKKILDDCREEFDTIAGNGKGSKKSNILFSAIMKFRRVCNHGDIKINTTAPQRSTHLTVPKMKRRTSPSPTAEPSCEFCSNASLEEDLLVALDSCPLCGRLLSEGFFKLPSAAASPQTMPSSRGSPLDIDMVPPEPLNADLRFLGSSNDFKKQSSKMSKVVENINLSCLDKDSKSVVFSSWRDTLDILAKILMSEGIPFVQIDGRNPLMGRTELLSRFRQDPTVKVLLISINTGAVGLTLTEANMVHIVEPQWNPTIEDQAIARVVRMGQTRPVTVYRYIMNESVEQSVLKLQQRKTQIIKLSMQDKTDDESDSNLDRFKFAIDPNEWEVGC